MEMEKSIYTNQLDKALILLKNLRQNAGLTQLELAIKLNKPQSFVSKYESGERRLDIIELIAICDAVNKPVSEYIFELERIINETK